MKTALPWILVVVLLGAVYFLVVSNKEKAIQLAAAQDQAQELATLRAENEELHRQPASGADLGRLKMDNEELLRLRSENQRLQSEAKQSAAQLAAARAGGSQAEQERQQELNKLAEENEALKAAQAAGTNETPAVSCIANLRQISMAKQLWAQDNKKGPDEVPEEADLKPYLPNIDKLACPEGGAYTLNAVNTPPACSIPGHTLAPQTAPQQ